MLLQRICSPECCHPNFQLFWLLQFFHDRNALNLIVYKSVLDTFTGSAWISKCCQSTTWTLPQSHFLKMTTQRRRQERRQEGKRQRFSQSSWVTALCVCCKNPPFPDPFVGSATGGDVKQSKKAYFLLHYVPTKLPISLPPSQHNSFIDWETQLVSSNFSDQVQRMSGNLRVFNF